MKRIAGIVLLLTVGVAMHSGCDAKKDPVSSGREAVKDVVTQPFNTLDTARDSLKKSEEKSKTAIEELDKENK
jgi:hypothetical protein